MSQYSLQVSVVTVCKNCAPTLSQAIASIQTQNGIEVQHVVIDNCSSDGSKEIVGESKSVSVFVSEPDNGIYDAMNKGIRLVNGEIVGILNADDFYASPLVLEKVAAVFQDPDIETCYGDLQYVDAADVNKVVRHWKSGVCSPEKFYWGWMPPHPTFFVRRSVYERYGLFNLELGSAADYELMLRFLVKHRIKAAYIPEVLVKMRTGGISNASLRNRLLANRMDRRAWEVNQLHPYPWTLYLKPLRKIGQWLVK